MFGQLTFALDRKSRIAGFILYAPSSGIKYNLANIASFLRHNNRSTISYCMLEPKLWVKGYCADSIGDHFFCKT